MAIFIPSIRNSSCSVSIFLVALMVLSTAGFSWLFSFESYGKAFNLSEQGEFKLAENELCRTICVNPFLLEAYMARSTMANATGNYELALSDTSIVLFFDCHNSNAYLNRGIAYKNLGDCRSAFVCYNKSISFDPKNYFAYNCRGNLFCRIGKFDEAIRDYSAAIFISPTYPISYLNRSTAFSKCNDEPGALRDFESYDNLVSGRNG